MALPTLQRKLFQNDGYGPLLKDEIVSRHISVQDWSNAYDYAAGVFARGSDGAVYMSKQPSGPSTSAINPVQDDGTFWRKQSIETPPAGDRSDSPATTAWVRQWYENELLAVNNVFVDPVNGDDDNSGTSSDNAVKTISRARDILFGYGKIINGYKNMYLAAGVYDENINSLVDNDVTVFGPSSGYATVNYIDVVNGAVLRLAGNIRLASGYAIECKRDGVIYLSDGLNLNLNNWSAPRLFYVFQGGSIYTVVGADINISFTGTCSVSGSVMQVANSARIISYGAIHWSGRLTSGQKYSAYRMGMIYGMGAESSLPGTTAGSVGEVSVFHS